MAVPSSCGIFALVVGQRLLLNFQALDHFQNAFHAGSAIGAAESLKHFIEYLVAHGGFIRRNFQCTQRLGFGRLFSRTDARLGSRLAMRQSSLPDHPAPLGFKNQVLFRLVFSSPHNVAVTLRPRFKCSSHFLPLQMLRASLTIKTAMFPDGTIY